MDTRVVTDPEHQSNIADPIEPLINNLGDFLEQHELDLLLKHSKISSFTSGETILYQGEKTDKIYFILEGTIQVNAQIMGRGNTNLETLHQGQFLTSIALSESYPCPTSFITTCTTVCLIIPNSYFELLAVDYPETKYKILCVITQQMCMRLKIIHDEVTSLISDSDMTSLSFFERVIHSLNQPKKIFLDEGGIDKALVHKVPALQSFTQDEVNFLCTHFIILDAPKNCKLMGEGEKKAYCYVVLYGAIQSCIIKDGKLAKLSVIGPGTLLASIGCIDNNAPFNMTYITCEQTILCKLPESALLLIKENHPQLWYKLFNLIGASLTALKKSIDKLDIRLHIENYNR